LPNSHVALGFNETDGARAVRAYRDDAVRPSFHRDGK